MYILFLHVICDNCKELYLSCITYEEYIYIKSYLKINIIVTCPFVAKERFVICNFVSFRSVYLVVIYFILKVYCIKKELNDL